MKIKKVHYFSGLVISVFVIVHLINHLYSLFGAAAHIEFMDNFRVFYRNVLAESVLVLAVAFQIFSGIKLFLEKRKTASGFFEKLQLWSGLYLAFFFLIHLSAVFSGRLFMDLDTNFYFGVAGLNTFPHNLFFVPYYSLAIISFFGHIASVHAVKMKSDILGLSPERQSKVILKIGLLLTLVILYGLTNRFDGVDLPAEYKIMVEEF